MNIIIFTSSRVRIQFSRCCSSLTYKRIIDDGTLRRISFFLQIKMRLALVWKDLLAIANATEGSSIDGGVGERFFAARNC